MLRGRNQVNPPMLCTDGSRAHASLVLGQARRHVSRDTLSSADDLEPIRYLFYLDASAVKLLSELNIFKRCLDNTWLISLYRLRNRRIHRCCISCAKSCVSLTLLRGVSKKRYPCFCMLHQEVASSGFGLDPGAAAQHAINA